MLKEKLRIVINWIIRILSILAQKLQDKSFNPYDLDDLSPIDNIENGESYFKALEWALQNKDIQNIAVTGPYGSGKSSVIRTFQKNHHQYNYLNITLASFNDGAKDSKLDSEDPKILADEDRLVEISILQQIFYKVKSRSIPDSRFKRIRSLGIWKLSLYIGLIIFVLLSVIELLNPRFYNQFSFWETFIMNYGKVVPYISLAFIVIAIVMISRYLLRFFASKQFEKLNITSGEIAIQSDNEKSILNKHLDEILYFFEVNPFNVVIIEDLDRFKNHEIFTKLREINFLLNNSRQIQRKIVFVYALKDDMFLDKTRTKFFEFILPIIPIVNWSNSFAIFLEKLSKPALNVKVDEKFIRDITLYIDDMRILKNIFNEFIIYKENLRSLAIDHNKLLGIIIYKNIYPTDFAELHENGGIVYKVFQQLSEIKSNEIGKIDQRVNEINEQIDKSDTELLKNIRELRAVYIQAIFDLFSNTKSVKLDGAWRSSAQLKEDQIFPRLQLESRIIVWSDPGETNSRKAFKDIEKIVDANDSYEQRAKAIENKSGSTIYDLRKELSTLVRQKNQINSYSLNEFLNAFPEAINSFDKKFTDKELLIYLLREGYIDEMYTSLTSYFYEGSLTKNDMDYLLSIKNQTPLDFTLKLTKLDEIIKGVTITELKRHAVLNYSFIDYLLDNRDSLEGRFESVFSQFKFKEIKYIEFLYSYIDKGLQQGLFIASICEYWTEFWNTVAMDNKITADKQDHVLRLIITHSDMSKINLLNKGSILSDYISNKPDFLLLIPEENYLERMKKAMDQLQVKFKNLFVTNETSVLLDHIYQHNYYALNSGMIEIMIKAKAESQTAGDNLTTSNYSAIQNSGCSNLAKYVEDNIDEYIANVFLRLDSNINEPEDSLLKLLNNEEIAYENKEHIIEKEVNVVSNISDVPEELWETIFKNEKVMVNWSNVVRYFSTLESIDDTLGTWLNKEANYIKLAQTEIEPDGAEENKDRANAVVLNLSRELIMNSKISDHSFEKLVSAIKEEYDGDLPLGNIDDSKISALISHELLNITPANFNVLKKNDRMRLLLMQKYIAEFIENIREYSLETKDVMLLLRSKDIDLNDKLNIIVKMPDELITGQHELADQICDLIKNTSIDISQEKLKKILTYARRLDDKLILLINRLKGKSSSEIDELLSAMESPYSLIIERGKRPSIPFTKENLELILKLQELDYISSYKTENEEEKIRVDTKQAES